jgi:uncharacterized membrane protein (DUF441 family)
VLSSRQLTIVLLHINAVRTEQSVTLNVKGLVILRWWLLTKMRYWIKEVCDGAGYVSSVLEYKVLSTRQLTIAVIHINVVRTEQSVTLNVKGLVIL